MEIKVHSILGIKKIIGQGEVKINIHDGGNLKALIDKMCREYGNEFSLRMYGESNSEPLPFIRLMVNGRDIGFLEGLETNLKDGDEVLILPPVSGG